MRRLSVLLVIIAAVAAGGAAWVVGHPPGRRAPAVSVASRTVTVERDGRSFHALVVRPTGGGSYPIVGFAHGFIQGPQRYRPLLEAIAKRGYIVIGPDTQTGPLPDPAALATDLLDAIRWAQANEPGADRARSAVAGHSMGGGVAVQLLATHPTIDTAVVLAPAAGIGAWDVEARRARQPAAYIVGTADRIVPIAESLVLASKQSGPTTTYVIEGGSHCGFVGTIGLAGIPCDFGAIPAERQSAITQGIVLAWLERELKDGPRVSVPGGVTVRRRAAASN